MERPPGQVLITGITGFLGGHLAVRLRAAGVAVRGLGRDPDKGRILQERLGVEFLQGQLEDAADMARACQGVDTVFHAGALSAPWGKRADFVRSNVDGTRVLLAAARQALVRRVVHVSTPSLYFHGKSGLNVPENAALPAPVNEYVRTKRLAEILVQEAAQGGLETVILRPRALIGAGDTAILPRLVRALERNRLPVIGDGENLTDLTCVENAAQAMEMAATAPAARVSGKIYNITNGTPVLLWEILGEVARVLDLPVPSRRIPRSLALTLAALGESAAWLTGREPALTRYSVGVLADGQTLDINAARRDLGYAPEVPLDEGVRRFTAWWRAGAGYPFYQDQLPLP